jgi:exonuclease III
MEQNSKINFISWNVRGLNERNKRLAVRQTVLLEKPDAICFQETKLRSMNDKLIKEISGCRLSEFRVLDAVETRGGILIAWRNSLFSCQQHTALRYTLTVTLKDKRTGMEFMITGVYGPSASIARETFFQELLDIRPQTSIPWLLCGDFNVTLLPQDRNTASAQWRGPILFADLISQLGLINLNLHGRNYTWSNARADPSMARLDRFLISTEWNALFPNSLQKSLPNTSSDHCPVLYTANTNFRVSRLFRFENCWLRSRDFVSFVRGELQDMSISETPNELHEKFSLLQRKINTWTKEKGGNIKCQIQVCRDFLGWFDKVQEIRQTTELENVVRALLKKRYTDLSVQEEDIWKQRAKVKWELQGDRNTNYFHAVASGFKRGNQINQIEVNGQLHSDQKIKAGTFFEFYSQLMGTDSPPTPHINWQSLYETTHDLSEMENPISEQEIIDVLQSWPNNKSPGPEGFTGEFYKTFQDLLTP